jgi:hypothetical protein
VFDELPLIAQQYPEGFVSAKLPDDRVLDQAAMRALVKRASVNR